MSSVSTPGPTLNDLSPPQLAPLLPMLYVAWMDGVLNAGEILALRERASTLFPWMEGEVRAGLLAWLNPDQSPAPRELEALGARVREAASQCPDDVRSSLAALGLGLSRLFPTLDGPWDDERAVHALDELEAQLGVVGAEATRSLLGASESRRIDPTALFDVDVLRGFLQEPHGDLRREVLALLSNPKFRIRPRPSTPKYRQRVLGSVRMLADRGYGRLAFPVEQGGQDDPSAAVAVFETLGYGDLSVMVKFGVQFGLFGGAVLQLGTRSHHALLPDIGSLALPGCFAMTEVGHGSNVRGIQTTATYDPTAGELIVDTPGEQARKDWIGNAAAHAKMASVFAQLEVDGQGHGVHVVLVPIRDDDGRALPRVTLEDCGEKVGLNGVDNGRISFDAVRVPRTNLLDRYARITSDGEYESPIPSKGRRFFTMLGALVAGRVSIAAASVSVAKTALTTAIRYGDGRHQFGPAGAAEVPILDYLVHQRALLPKLATTYGLHFAVRDLTRQYAAGDPEQTNQVEALAAGLKSFASRHVMETVQAAREACGGRGYLADNRFGELRADADIFTTFEGANPVLMQLVARALLSRYRDEMGDLKAWDLVRHLAERGQVRVTEMNPVVTRNTDEEHLRDPDFLSGALSYREERLLASLARRLKGRIDDGVDSFDALNACQDHMIALAQAHVERVVYDQFLEGVSRAPTPGLSEALRVLSDLYALHRLEEDRAWYLEAGYFDPPKSRAIRRLVNSICTEVREQAVFLVDGFGIPDAVLEAPDGRRR